MSHRDVNIRFTDESIQDVDKLSKSLGVSAERVIGQAIALLKMVQGRKVILKTDKDAVEISNYASQPQQVEIKK